LKNYLKLKTKIKKNEGFRDGAYLDILGFLTIGYGHLIKKHDNFLLKKKYTKFFLLKVFNDDFKKTIIDYSKNYKNDKHPKNIQEIYIEMIFQMGIKKQKKFVKMNQYIKKKQLFMASLEMKKSLWFKQTPKRVDILIKSLLKNLYER